MSSDGRIEELAARLTLAQGTPTLIIMVADSDARLDEARARLAGILRGGSIDVADLGACDIDTGPARWSKLTRERAADAYILSASPWGPFSGPAFAVLLNTEREFLRELAGPVLLLVSRETEKVIRARAPDFFTWAARAYELPNASELAVIAKRQGILSGQVVSSKPEEPPIRFLHVSDLHLRPQRVRRYDQDRVLRGFVDFLERDRARFPLDLVFVTGDLAFSGKPEEFALVTELFRRIMDVTGVSREHFFVVPGNHDVDRDVSRWLRRTLDKDEDAIQFFEEEPTRRFHLQKFDAYRQSLAPLLGEGRSLGLGVGGAAVEIVTVRGVRIAIGSFNSAFFAQGDDDHGKLWLGEPNVERAGDRIADAGASFAIALFHHPFEELHEVERDSVERRFERLFDLVLRGHMHQQKSRGVATQRGGYIELAAPSAYQGSPWPNGCLLGELRPRTGTLRVYPYAYASGADPWVLDTKVFPDDADTGYTHLFTVPEKRRTPSALRRNLAKATEEAVQAAPEAVQRQFAKELGIDAPSSRISRDVAKKVAKAAAAKIDDPALLAKVVDAERMGKALSQTAADELEAEGRPKIPRSDKKFLEKSLLRAFEHIREMSRGHISNEMMREGVVGKMLASALVYILDGPVAAEPSLAKGSRPDIVIGTEQDPPERRAVIELKMLPRRDADISGVPQLDRYLTETGALHGALVYGVPHSSAEDKPEVTYAKTPQGRDVLVLRIPLA
jgi:hypothetical protein